MNTTPPLHNLLRRAFFSLIILLLIGAAYQALASARDRRNVPPPGERVEVNNHMMHLYCIGTGSPTVILEAGRGGSWIDWAFVHNDIGQQTRTCAYDRLGQGWSEPAPTPQSAEQIAKTLQQLLSASSIEPPYVMVGHSSGGVYVREFAFQFPDAVTGMVLVDSAHEQQNLRFPDWAAEEDAAFVTQLQLCRALAPFGLLRAVGFADGLVDEFEVDQATRDQFVAMFNQTHVCTASVRETQAMNADLSQASSPKPLGELPLVVLARGIGEADEISADDLPPSLTIQDLEILDTLWAEMQLELAALSTNSMFIVAEESMHIIQNDQPELVIEVVQTMLSDLR